MSGGNSPRFLDIQSYRKKRRADAARILPLLGAILLIFPFPFLFVKDTDPDSAVALSAYLFLIWIGMVAATFLLSHQLRDRREKD